MLESDNDILRSLAPGDMDFLELEEEVDYEEEASGRPRSATARPSSTAASRGAKGREKEKEAPKAEARGKRRAAEPERGASKAQERERRRTSEERKPKQPISWRAWKGPDSRDEYHRGRSRSRSRSWDRNLPSSGWRDLSRSPPGYWRRSPPHVRPRPLIEDLRRARSGDPLYPRHPERFPPPREFPRGFGGRHGSPPPRYHRLPGDYLGPPPRGGDRREADVYGGRKEPALGSPAWEEWNRLREFEFRLLQKEQELQDREGARRGGGPAGRPDAYLDRAPRGEYAEPLFRESDHGRGRGPPLRRARSHPEDVPWIGQNPGVARVHANDRTERGGRESSGVPRRGYAEQPKEVGALGPSKPSGRSPSRANGRSPSRAEKRRPEPEVERSAKDRVAAVQRSKLGTAEDVSGKKKPGAPKSTKPTEKVGKSDAARLASSTKETKRSREVAELPSSKPRAAGGGQIHSMELRARCGEPATNPVPDGGSNILELRTVPALRPLRRQSGELALPPPPPPPHKLRALAVDAGALLNSGERHPSPNSPIGRRFLGSEAAQMQLRSGSRIGGTPPEDLATKPVAADFRPERNPQRAWVGHQRRPGADDKFSEWFYRDPQGTVQGPASKFQLRQWLTQLANANDKIRHQMFCNVRVWREGSPTESTPLLQLLNTR